MLRQGCNSKWSAGLCLMKRPSVNYISLLETCNTSECLSLAVRPNVKCLCYTKFRFYMSVNCIWPIYIAKSLLISTRPTFNKQKLQSSEQLAQQDYNGHKVQVL